MYSIYYDLFIWYIRMHRVKVSTILYVSSIYISHHTWSEDVCTGALRNNSCMKLYPLGATLSYRVDGTLLYHVHIYVLYNTLV